MADEKASEGATKLPLLRETAWIDGLRGYVALYTCFMHLWVAFHHVENGTTGTLLIFYILGGYIAARTPIQLMHAREPARLLQSLSNSAFRRALRLYCPSFISIAMISLLAYLGLFELVRPYTAKDTIESYFPGMHPPQIVKRFDRLQDQFKYCFQDMYNMLNVWPQRQYAPVHNTFLWGIREEFIGSIHLSYALLACARVRPLVRLSVIVLIGHIHLIYDRWHVALCFFGAAIAQGEVLVRQSPWFNTWRDVSWPDSESAAILESSNGSKPSGQRSTMSKSRSMTKTSDGMLLSTTLHCLWVYTLYIAVVLAFYPPAQIEDGNNLGAYAKRHKLIVYLEKIIPSIYPQKYLVFDSLGCSLFVACMISAKSDSLARYVFANKIAQYLGRNFFGVILVQHAVLQAGGFLVPHLVWGWLEEASHDGVLGTLASTISPEHQILLGLAVGFAVNVPITILLADLFTRTVLRQCMILIFMLEKAIMVDDSKLSSQPAS